MPKSGPKFIGHLARATEDVDFGIALLANTLEEVVQRPVLFNGLVLELVALAIGKLRCRLQDLVEAGDLLIDRLESFQ